MGELELHLRGGSTWNTLQHPLLCSYEALQIRNPLLHPFILHPWSPSPGETVARELHLGPDDPHALFPHDGPMLWDSRQSPLQRRSPNSSSNEGLLQCVRVNQLWNEKDLFQFCICCLQPWSRPSYSMSITLNILIKNVRSWEQECSPSNPPTETHTVTKNTDTRTANTVADTQGLHGKRAL